MTTVGNYPGFSAKASPEVFVTVPKQPDVKKPGQLSEKQVQQYFEKGYVVVEDFFSNEELDPCKKDIEMLVEDLAQRLYKAGKIKDLYNDYGLYQRLTKIEEDFPGANVVLHKLGIITKGFLSIWSNERLLNIMEQLLGPDISGHPVWNLRTKTPQSDATTVPWHQDSAYLENCTYDQMTPTAWIPFIDADETNGCMEVAVGGHRSGKIATHQCCFGGTWYIMLEEDEMAKTLGVNLKEDLKVCPVPYGGFLLFNNLIPHRSLPNLSKDIRWSIDLRWQKTESPVGFYGLKEAVLMRSSTNSDVIIDWDGFNQIDRHAIARAQAPKINEVGEEEEFDTTFQGPWMKKWELVHMNVHTDGLQKNTKDTWHGIRLNH